jgi:hypothetical protein
VDYHCFFGLPLSLNDINVLHRSNLFDRLASGDGAACNCKVNGHDYTMGYYLANDTYLSWATFVKTVPTPQNKERAEFANAQEACQNDIERAFGVLQAWFCHCSWSGSFFGQKTLKNIMTCCVILHNMIIEDERDLNLELFYDNIGSRVKPQRNPDNIQAFLEIYRQTEDSVTHTQLNNNLIENHW